MFERRFFILNQGGGIPDSARNEIQTRLTLHFPQGSTDSTVTPVATYGTPAASQVVYTEHTLCQVLFEVFGFHQVI
jgi:hypothetical protein